MRYREGAYLGVRFAVLGICLVTSAACARRSAAAEDDRAAALRADSTRVARAEQIRSSASQVVTFDEGERTRYTRVEHMLQRFSGVQVTPKGGGFAIQIRGTGSFASNNEPLVIVDGATRSTSDLGRIDPRDVERIEVVKDAAASFYGVRGANGVILIKTRRGT